MAWSLHDTLNPAIAYELTEYGSRSLGADSANNFNNWTSTGMTLSTVRRQSLPNSFFTGTGNNLTRFIDSDFPYHVVSGDSLRLWTAYGLESDWDYAYVEISTDGVTFTPIRGNISSLSNPNGNNRGFGFTGSSSGVLAKFSLGAYVGQDVYVRLSMYTDQALYEEGVYFDDISPVQKFGLKTVVSSTLTDTTYSFTNHINGTFYYRVRGQDAQGQWSRFSQPDMTVVAGQFACVDTDIDGFGDPGHPENTCPTDNCPAVFNPGQADADSDGIGDVCDACPQDPTNDADNDGICGLLDNCPIFFNPLQEDANQDGIGDACCCVGTVGNVDCDAQGTVDIGDLTALINNLFITFTPLCCANEAEFSGTPGIDIGDLTQMISTLFVTFAPPPACPQ